MDKFPEFSQFIDLVKQPDAGKEFHAYLLSQCEFFVGTASGPSWVSRLFGKPSLITNVTEIGTQMSRGPGASIYLPKRYIHPDGRSISMREVFEQGFAFASLDKAELKSKGFAIVHNTETEISLAVKEILDTYRDFHVRSEQTHPNIRLLRSEFQAVANGNFARSYIEHNKEFFN
jgi:putative glycosyltransferase (TIGR04372 family)